jgi:3-phenylpropionate/trans-cinnamate dioxygenase ferredoxin reductase subunit
VAAVDETGVTLTPGDRVDGDVVVAATGVRPDIRLATDAGLATRQGRVVADEHMHTSAHNVYAAGDVTIAYNVAAARPVVSEHWRDAARQGLIAGLTAAGQQAAWNRVPGFSCRIGDFTLSYRGWGGDFDESTLTDAEGGFSVVYRSGRAVVGTLAARSSPAS